MGRVDEAMRRVAEVGQGTPPKPSGEITGPPTPFSDAADDVFPPEPVEWPRLRPVIGGGAAAVSPTAPPLLPPLSARLGNGLSRKVVIDQDIDPASREQYRRLATSLYAAQGTHGLKVVMVASAMASEGKSLTASNLALTFSESYQLKVLLIDGDLRRPSLHSVFGLDATPGLTDGLTGPDHQQLTLHHLTSTLSVLTAGEPTSDPMAVLASDRMRRLVAEARDRFDWVVIDTPPVGLLADASLLAEIADGALLVVRAGVTPYDLVQRAVATLGRERVLGVVLNQAQVTLPDGYKSYYQTSR